VTIKIEIELREGEDLRSKLAAALPMLFSEALSVAPARRQERVTTAAEDAEVAGLPPVPVPVAYGDPNTVPIIRDGEVVGVEPAPPKRGRKPKAAEPAPQVWTVRRYAGHIEGEFNDTGEAAEKLAELIRLAQEPKALDDLLRHNAEEMERWPRERLDEINEIVGEVRMQMIAGEPPAPTEPDAVEVPGPHSGRDGKPLESLSRDKPSATNAVFAYASRRGAAGMTVVLEKFGELGMQNVSSLADDDPRLGQIVDWLAPKLGLEVVA
jgi:hypothetical protein